MNMDAPITSENGFSPRQVRRMTRRRLQDELRLAHVLDRDDGVLEALSVEIARRAGL